MLDRWPNRPTRDLGIVCRLTTKALAELIGAVRLLDKTKVADELISAVRQCCKE